MKRNKGIAIELTALLDVILIMLFWVMMSMRNETEEIRSQAEEQQQEYEQRFIEMNGELDEAHEEYSKLEEEYSRLLSESSETIQAANQKALDEFAQGRLLTLNLKYDAVGKLFIMSQNEELGRTMLDSSEKIGESIKAVFESEGITGEDVILCAFVYDGSRALYSDVKRISEAVEDVSSTYRNFYCTYINTSK